jgi:hypothetical protein
MEVPEKMKNRVTILFCYTILAIYPEKTQSQLSAEIPAHPQ